MAEHLTRTETSASEFTGEGRFGGGSRFPLDNVESETLLDEAKRVIRVEKGRWKGQNLNWYGWLATFIPFFGWIRTYQWKQWLLPDVAAGLSVAAMVVPQGMSYAQNLAFLPQVYGLYGAFTPCIFYALLGSSRQLAVGPVAVTSLILGTGLSDIYGKFAVNPSDPENALIGYKQHQYNVGAIQVAFIAGVFYTAVGLFRLGFVVRILGHPMISGFMSGAVLIIATGQFKYLALQMSLPRADTLQGNLYYLFTPQPNNKVFPPAPFPFQWRQFVICIGFFLGLALIKYGVPALTRRLQRTKYKERKLPFLLTHLSFILNFLWSVLNIFIMCWVVYWIVPYDETPWRWRETAMGGSFVLILWIIKTVAQSFRRLRFLAFLGPLIVCIISIAIMNIGKYYVLDPDNPNTPLIKPVGLIPKGLPPVTISWWFPLYETGKMITLALLICLVDVCESVSIAKALAQRNHYRLDGTQELRGLGLANIVGAMFNCYTTTGSFSRSAVNNSVGAKTPLAQMITGFTVMLVLLVLTPVFENMSANVQGAIIIFGIFPLFDGQEFFYLWKVSKFDWLVWVTGMLITAFSGVEMGILASVAVSVIMVLVKHWFPVVKVLSVVPGTTDFKDSDLFPEAVKRCEHAVVIRVEGPLDFLNAEAVKEYTREQLEKAREANPKRDRPIAHIILDLTVVPTVDSTTVHLFGDFIIELKKHYDNTQLMLVNPNVEVVKALKRANIFDKIGKEHIYLSVSDAVEAAAAADANLTPTISKPSASYSGTPTERHSSDADTSDKPPAAASATLV